MEYRVLQWCQMKVRKMDDILNYRIHQVGVCTPPASWLIVAFVAHPPWL